MSTCNCSNLRPALISLMLLFPCVQRFFRLLYFLILTINFDLIWFVCLDWEKGCTVVERTFCRGRTKQRRWEQFVQSWCECFCDALNRFWSYCKRHNMFCAQRWTCGFKLGVLGLDNYCWSDAKLCNLPLESVNLNDAFSRMKTVTARPCRGEEVN